MSLVFNIVTVVGVAAGAFFFLAGTVGLIRFPDTLTRLHALTKADNLGLGLIVLGLLPQTEGIRAGLKLVAVWLLAQLASAGATRLVARAVRRPGGSDVDRTAVGRRTNAVGVGTCGLDRCRTSG